MISSGVIERRGVGLSVRQVYTVQEEEVSIRVELGLKGAVGGGEVCKLVKWRGVDGWRG